MCESIGHRPLRGRCPKSGKTHISALAHPSATGGRVSGLVLRVAAPLAICISLHTFIQGDEELLTS